ncbi:carbohydrate ABC transporter permease [Kouleothrix sp.]|uniref:carbohydrate ABC transporter permease n=1 Tax=Kouleothrix sp. TaxID=2779161 RepID=UPI00391CE20F
MNQSLAPALPAERRRVRVRMSLRAGAVAAVTLLALLLRARAALVLPADFDEDDYLRAGQLYAQHIAAGDIAAIVNERENYEHPPMSKLAFGAVLYATQPPGAYATPVAAGSGDTPAKPAVAAQARSLRLFGAVVGALTAGLVAIANPLAGLLVALNSWHIKYTSQAMLEALPCLLATLALLLLRRSGRNGDAWWWGAALALGAAAAGKYLYGVGGAAAIVWTLWRGRAAGRTTARTWALAAAWGLAALVMFYALDPALWPDPIGRLRASLLFNVSYTTGKQVSDTGFGWAYQLVWLLGAVPWHPGVFPLMLDGLFLALALLSWRQVLRAEPLAALWFAVNLLFLFFWPTKWPQYTLALSAPIGLAAAVPLGRMGPRLRAALRRRGRVPRGALLWLLPTLLLFGLIGVYPLLLQTALATTSFSVRNLRGGALGLWGGWLRGIIGLPPAAPNAPAYNGLGGITFLLSWPEFLNVVRFNITWVATTMLLASALGVWLATLLARRGLRGRTLWRMLFILPWAIPEFVGALVWSTIFDDQFGPVNLLTGRSTNWLDDTAPLVNIAGWLRPLTDRLAAWHLAPFSETLGFIGSALSPTKGFLVLVLVSVWVAFPFMMLISTAALRGIPAEVLDAARVDGAEGWTLWRSMTWPLIRPAVLSGMLLRGILLFNAFHIPLMLFSDPQRPGAVPLAMVGYFVIRYDSDYTLAALINTVVLGLAIALVWLFNRRTQVAEGVQYV